jgi:hypothetical protein
MADKYYPSVGELITIDQLPDALSFINEDLQTIFDQTRYQNFVSQRSMNFSSGYYELDIYRPRKVSRQRTLRRGKSPNLRVPSETLRGHKMSSML